MTGPIVGRIRDRATFRQLRRPEGRGSRGPIRVAFVPRSGDGSDGFPQVGYAIGRQFGNAVQRNRLRRRLRAAARESAPTALPGGYLVYASPGAARLTHRELVGALRAAMQGASAAAAGYGSAAQGPGR